MSVQFDQTGLNDQEAYNHQLAHCLIWAYGKNNPRHHRRMITYMQKALIVLSGYTAGTAGMYIGHNSSSFVMNAAGAAGVGFWISLLTVT